MENSNLIIAAITAFLAALALWFGVWKSKQESIKSRPLLRTRDLRTGISQENGVFLENVGHNPAEIEEFKLFVNGTSFQIAEPWDWINFIQAHPNLDEIVS